MINNRINFQAGIEAEGEALTLLRTIHEVEDRTAWALDKNRPYAMDFYFPKLQIAVDFKYKNINTRHNSFYLEEGHYKKYTHYVESTSNIKEGWLWYVDRRTNNEYLISINKIRKLISRGTVRRYYSGTYKQQWESGGFYAIPVECFNDITQETYSLKSTRTRQGERAN